MHADDLQTWQEELEAFQARFASLFVRSEPRCQAADYMRGLMSPIERKNGWHLAEHLAQQSPDATQRLLYRAQWSADDARDRLVSIVAESFGHPDGIGVLDETGFLKKGTKSVGVARQYSGTAGKVDNCQIGVFLAYVGHDTHVLVDRRLYLPQAWCDDTARCRRAGVPESVSFQTKPALGTAMLKHCWDMGLPMRWVTGDEVYGNACEVRDFIAAHDRLYVLAVASTTPAWLTRPQTIAPLEQPTAKGQKKPNGRPRIRRRLAAGAQAVQTVAHIVNALPTKAWKRLALLAGEKGPRRYDWARVRVIESRKSLDGPEAWLLVRRSIDTPSERAYYLSNASEKTSLEELVTVAMQRYAIEQCFGEVKEQLGLDHYEVRTWNSWHRHVTLTLMAHVWLASMRARNKKIGGRATHRVSRAQSRGSASAAGNRSTAANTLGSVPSAVVSMATTKAASSPPQSLQTTRRKPR